MRFRPTGVLSSPPWFPDSNRARFTTIDPVGGQRYLYLNGSCLHFGASILGWFHLQT
jgi:hypothetical protein